MAKSTTKKRDAAPALRLHGPAHKLRGEVGALPLDGDLELVLEKALGPFAAGAALPLKIRSRAGGAPYMALRLPRQTPPGRYLGQVRAGKKKIKAEVEVAGSMRLAAHPSVITLHGKTKGKAKVTMSVENRGNLTANIPETAGVGIYDDDGIETAFASTYRQDLEKPLDLLGHFIGKLQQGHGGLLKLHIREGAGPLAPGDRRLLSIDTTLAAKLLAKHSYHGVWSLENLNLAVEVTVEA